MKKKQATKTVLICRPQQTQNKVHNELLKRIIELFSIFGYTPIFSQLEEKQNNINIIKQQFKKADIVLILPGGIEIIEYLFTCIHENKKIEKPKEIILLNFGHFYQMLIDTLIYYSTNEYKDESILNFLITYNTEDEIEFLLEQKEKKLLLNINS